MITVSRGARTWVALVEVKTGANDLVAAQIEAYLDLAREHEFDALLTISNQYVTLSSAFPVAIDRKKLRRIQLHHWSGSGCLPRRRCKSGTAASRTPIRRTSSAELIRYLSDGRSGIVMFGDMGPSWTAVRDGARMRTLRKVRSTCRKRRRTLGRDDQVSSAGPEARAQAAR